MQERPNKTSICGVVCLDISDQANKPVFRQIQDKTLFDSLVSEALKDVAPDDRVVADTESGRTIAIHSAPEAAIFIAMMIRDAVNQHNQINDEKLMVRTGISIGPVRVEEAADSVALIQGDGVKAAERMKMLAEPGQILVTRAYHDITAGLTEEIASLFSPFQGGNEAYAIRSPHEEPFVSESATGLADAPPLMSRLLDSENSFRYGLWGSAALVAIIMLVGGFLLFSNMLRPDLGVVISDSKSAAPGADVRAVSVPAPPMEPASTAMTEADPSLAEPDADFATPVQSDTSQTVTALEPEIQLPPTQSGSKKRRRVQAMESTINVDTEAPVEINSEPVIEVAEPAREEPVVVPQEEPKKVAASPPARKGPVVEERRISAGSRGKTLWDDFRESFKQGSTQQVCTQAEIALNQCK